MLHPSSWPLAAIWMTFIVIAGVVMLAMLGALPWQTMYEDDYDEDCDENDYEEGRDEA